MIEAGLHLKGASHQETIQHLYSPEPHQLIGETMSKQKIRSIRVKIKAGAVGINQRGH